MRTIIEKIEQRNDLQDYINKHTLRLQPGMVKGPKGQEALLDHGRSMGEWMLKYKGRVRWGDKDEIMNDIDFFETYGKLPDRKVGGF